VLREVVVHNQRVLPVVAEVLTHRGSRVWCDVLKRSRVIGGRRDHDGVFHRARLLQLVDQGRHRGLLLADRDVDAVHVQTALVDDRVDRNRGLPGLAVADDQLALAAPDRNHGVYGLDAGLQRLFNAFALHHAGRFDFNQAPLVGNDGPLAVNRFTQRVHDAADERAAHRHVGDAAGSLDGVALGDVRIGAGDNRADVVCLQVERDAHRGQLGRGVFGELKQLTRARSLQAVDARDAVADLQHLAHVHHLQLLVKAFQLTLDDAGNFFWS
jgi:hypothetical protein